MAVVAVAVFVARDGADSTGRPTNTITDITDIVVTGYGSDWADAATLHMYKWHVTKTRLVLVLV